MIRESSGSVSVFAALLVVQSSVVLARFPRTDAIALAV